MARRYAVLFFGYALVLWLTRNAPPSLVREAIVAGTTLVAAMMGMISLLGVLSATVGPAAWIAVVIEFRLAAAFGYLYLSGRGRRAAA